VATLKPKPNQYLMDCPHCRSCLTTKLQRTTNLGYVMFYCRDCLSTFNERTLTPFNFLEIPTDILFQVLLCRLRYKMSLRDVAEFFLLRGFEFTHETVRHWEERFAPLLADSLRAKRTGTVGKTWHVDETYLRIKGRWCYLYRAIDEDGNLVDSLLREHRDLESAKAFFAQALDLAETPPERVVTDGLSSYPRAIAEELGPEVVHEPGSCLDNPVEQDHRGIKQRYYPMLGFGAFESAKRFCAAFEEVRQYLRPRSRMKEFVSLSVRRNIFIERVQALELVFQSV
jgi:putative transposase